MGGVVNAPRTSEAAIADHSEFSFIEAQAQLSRLQQQMDLMRQVHVDLAAAFDSRQVLRTALSRSLQMAGATRGSIMLLDSQAGLVKMQMSYKKGTEHEVEQGRFFRLDETSIAGWVVQNNQAYICPDVDKDPLYNRRYLSPSRKSVLCVPIQSGDIAIGVINADSDQADFFTEEHERLLSRLANEVGFAIERASLIEALKDLSGATGDRKRLLSAIAESVVQLVHVPVCLVWLADERTGKLRAEAYPGFKEEDVIGLQLDKTDPLVKRSVDTFRSEKLPLYIADVQEIEGPHSAKARELGLLSVLAAPLLAGDDLVGLIGAHTCAPRQFSEWSKQLLVTFARQAATALENTRLMEAQRQRLALLETKPRLLQEIRLGMDTAWDLDTVLKLILTTGIMQGLAPMAVSANIMLHNRETGLLEMTTLQAPTLSPGEAELKQSDTMFEPGEGIAGHVLVTKKPYICPNIRKDGKARGIIFDHHKQALLCVPILSGETAIGVLNADGGEVDCFTEDHAEWLTTLADHAAIAIERVTLLESLKELKKNITSEEHLARSIAKGACDLLHVTGALVWLPEGEGGALTVAATERVSADAVTGWRMERDNSSLQKSLDLFHERRRPLMMWDASREPDFPYHQAAGGLGIVSVLTIPLLTERRLQGLITAYSDEIREFTARQRDVVIAFAEQAATAIENAELYQETEQRFQVMQASRETAVALLSEVELPTVLQSIVERAVELLDGKGGLVYLFNDATQKLEVAVSHGLGKDYRGYRLLPGEGLSGKAYQFGEPVIVEDYSAWTGRSPKWADEGFTATIAVPLMRGDEVIGVINVMDDKKRRTFTNDDSESLKPFAEQASVAIEVAQHREELLSTQALTVASIWGFGVAHGARQEGTAIRDEVFVLRRLLDRLPKDSDTQATRSEIEEHLESVVTAAHTIEILPVPRSLGALPAEPVVIDDELKTEVESHCRRRRPDVQPQFDLRCGQRRAQIDRAWLRLVMRSLLDNALETVPAGATLTITSECQDEQVEIRIIDQGTGIPAKVRPYFLRWKVPKEGTESGTGMGVVMARFILRKQGGDLRLVSTEEGEGTELRARKSITSRIGQTGPGFDRGRIV
jgi:GAF domain-containing protein